MVYTEPMRKKIEQEQAQEPGRESPSEAPEGTNRQRSFRFSDGEYEAWRSAAEAKKVSIAELIRRAMRAFLSG